MKRGLAILVASASLLGCQPQTPGPQAAAPVAPESQIAIGKKLLAVNQPEMALTTFKRSIAVDGVSADALIGVAVASLQLGRRKDARIFLDAAIEVDPNSAVARNNLGVLLMAEGDHGAAVSEFQLAFALTDGADTKIATNLAMAEHAFAAQLADQPTLDGIDYNVIQYGHGVFRLEPRAADAAPQDGENRS